MLETSILYSSGLPWKIQVCMYGVSGQHQRADASVHAFHIHPEHDYYYWWVPYRLPVFTFR